MIVGYARTSSTEQIAGFESQLGALREIGCEKIFQEQVSAIKRRDQLDAAIEFIREGDIFTVTKLDRLARSVQHLLELVDKLNAKGASLKVLNISLDTKTPTGKLMLTMLGAVAEFERALMLERQKDGVQAAKLAGKYKGRQPTARAKSAQIFQLIAEGCTRQEVAYKLNIGVASVYRALARQQKVA
jgi:DNA invertase Pin-like site-specific DNA recombinase